MMTQPLFTIEQVELIRRLRNSGVSKEDVLHAFDALDRLDNELQPLARSPHKDLTNQKGRSPYKPNTQGMTPPMSSDSSHSLMEAAGRNSFDLGAEETCPTLSASSPSHFSMVGAGVLRSPLPGSAAPFVSGALDEDTEEIKELLKAGEDALCEEIRTFVQQNQITQTQIALNSGVSQSYVSRYLRGDYCEMSARSCKAIYRWYLSARRKLMNAVKSDAIIFTSIATVNQPDLIVSRQLSVPTELSPSSCLSEPLMYVSQRRERFTFRPCHLEVLERYFSIDAYPNADKREEIATACNQAVNIASLGRPLSEREKVHPHIVSNWFANRRKDLKRSAKDGISESRSQTPGGRGRMRCASDDGQRLEPAQLLENGDRQSDLEQLEEQSLSMAVEVAAVNQAILSLTGQPSVMGGVKSDSLTNQTISFTSSEPDQIDMG